MASALQMIGVSAGYGSSPVLHDTDLTVPEGKVVALLGANGAGKSTLLKVCAGLLRPTAGRIVLHGEDVTRRREDQRAARGLCLVPEGHGVFRELSVRDNLAMFVGRRKTDDAIGRIETLFPVLAQRLAQEAGTLSGGQQQMLALSRAVLTGARTIMADELSLGLAPVIIDEIFAAVETLCAQGRSILIVEQYVSRALALADYVYILHKGRIAFVGEPDELEDEHVFEHYVGSPA
jgi:branched-chain amino acid transport system ATP-binding protein